MIYTQLAAQLFPLFFVDIAMPSLSRILLYALLGGIVSIAALLVFDLPVIALLVIALLVIILLVVFRALALRALLMAGFGVLGPIAGECSRPSSQPPIRSLAPQARSLP